LLCFVDKHAFKFTIQSSIGQDTQLSPYVLVLPCRILSFVKVCRHKYRRVPKIGEPWNSAVLEWEAWLTPRYTPRPNMCYHVKFGSSATNGVPINRRNPKIGSIVWPRSVGVGVWAWLTPKNNLIMLPRQIW